MGVFQKSGLSRLLERDHANPVVESEKIGVITIDRDGLITLVNDGGKKILQDIRGKRLPKTLVGLSIAELLDRRLTDTVIGRTLLTGQELDGQLLTFGHTRYMVITKLLRNQQFEVTGCTQYTIRVEEQEAADDLHVWQKFTRELAMDLGYNSTEWIDNISSRHAQQLARCLCTTEHTVPITEFCPYKFQCAFNPQYGWASLDRRSYYRVPTSIPVEAHLVRLPSGTRLSEELREKIIPGQTLDLSLGGIKFQCPIRLPLKSVIAIRFLDIPKPLVCEGEIMWHEKADGFGWLHGVKFSSLSSEDSSTIINLVTREQLKPRTASDRRKMDAPETALADSSVEHVIATLRNLLRAKSDTLFQHCMRTAAMAVSLGTSLGLNEKKLLILERAALIHDIGRLEIDRSIMEKSGPLTPEEEQIIKQHPIYGASLVKGIPVLKPLVPIIRHHHEHFDGTGYPDGLKGTRIPLLSRILAVANSVDVLTHRHFQNTEVLEPEQVVEVLASQAGSKFDPNITEKCIELIKDGDILPSGEAAR